MDPSIKRQNRIRLCVISIRNLSDLIWKQYANIYSKFLIRYSWTILFLGLLISVGLTICCPLLLNVQPFDQNYFVLPKGLTMTNARRIKEMFGNDTELRMHQQLNLYPGLDIIVKRKVFANDTNPNRTNMLDNQVIDEMRKLDKTIQSITVNDRKKSSTYNYSSLCTKMNQVCVIDGNYILTEKFYNEIYHLRLPKYGYYMDTSGANGIPEFMFGKGYNTSERLPSVFDYQEDEQEDYGTHSEDPEHIHSTTIYQTIPEKVISFVPLFRLRYSLNSATAETRQLSIDWERKVLIYLVENYKSEVIDVYATTSTAIYDEITKTAHSEGIYITFMFLIFFALLCLSISIQGNFHTSVSYLPICGIISFCLSTGATFGLISIFRVVIVEPMTLFIFIVAIIDGMRFSIVCGEYHRALKEYMNTLTDPSSDIDIEQILPSIIVSTHPYFIVSTLILSIVYLLFSICSPMLLTTPFCLTLAIYIFMNYIVHSTVFTSCLVMTFKRVSSNLHCLGCYRLPKTYHTNRTRRFKIFKVLRSNISSLFNIDSIWKKLLSAVICLLSIVFIVCSMWFALSVDTCLYEDRFLPRDAYSLRLHMQSQTDDFEMGPVIMFTIPKAVDYENGKTQTAMHHLLDQCINDPRTNKFRLIWLDYENITYITTGHDDLDYRITPWSKNDLIVSERGNYSTIEATRFYCQYKSIRGDREDIRTMNNMYTYASQSPLPSVFPYSLLFPSYESLGYLRIEICLLVLTVLLCCFIGTFITFISFKSSLIIISHFLALSAGTLTGLYLFHNLTYNFIVAPWLYVVSILYIDTLIHVCYNRTGDKWKYNRVIISLLISSLALYLFPIQTYIFRIIRTSIIYQSIICFILINVILPSWFYLFQPNNNNNSNDDTTQEQIDVVMSPTITTVVSNQSLTSAMEKSDIISESNANINDPR